MGREVSQAFVALLPHLLTLPWEKALLGGWPIFSIAGVLVRWSHLALRQSPFPYAFGTSRILMVPASAGAAELQRRRSACDDQEMGQAAETRRMLGASWRRRAAISTDNLTNSEEAAETSMFSTSLHTSEPWPSFGCPFGTVVSLLIHAVRELRDSAILLSDVLSEAQGKLLDWAQHRESVALASEAWSTEWPILELLSLAQHRYDLLSSPAHSHKSGTLQPQQPWAQALQRVLGFDDEAWGLATSDLQALAETKSVVPQVLQERVQCAGRQQCSSEFFARLHLLLHHDARLPVRDSLVIGPTDSLAQMHFEKSWDGALGSHDDSKTNVGEEQQPVQAQDLVPKEHPLQIDRRQLAEFVLKVRPTVTGSMPSSHCLEWDEPFLMLHAFGDACQTKDIFIYSEPNESEPRAGLPGERHLPSGASHYWGDFSNPLGVGSPFRPVC